ncbi:hypothetical protein KUTeg_011139 [Tegillarca granosa]|uniref:Uncharacterized protein n=1 Tax=Tegillarca granosa TaxID=220873 RepID=A0ABQ9F1U3_TEGGR|nr:hypothetical protein KUTeg_011139 [Tegillarca granosa]
MKKYAESSQTIRTQKGIHPFIHSFFYLKFKMKQTALCLFLLVCLLGTTVDAHRRGIGLEDLAGAYLGASILTSAFRPNYYHSYQYGYYPRHYYGGYRYGHRFPRFFPYY